MSDNKHLNCQYRVVENGILSCGLARSILKTDSPLLIIDDSTCEKCCKNEIPTDKKISSVVAELLVEAASTIVDLGGIPDCSEERAQKLLDHIDKSKKRPCNCKKTRNLHRDVKDLY